MDPHEQRVAELIAEMESIGWQPGKYAGWDRTDVECQYARLIDAGYQQRTLPLAAAVLEVADARKPDTVRGIMYAMVSLGWLPDTEADSYRRVQYLLKTLRTKHRIMPFAWIVDNIRSTIKSSSWSGLNDYIDTVRDAYRRDFWASLDDYVALIVEKDTVAGRLVGLADEYDVPIHPLRGFVSDTFGWEIARDFDRMEKKIHVYYIGDHDPSGLAIEQSCIEKIREITDADFAWERIAVLPEHFDEFKIRPLKPKRNDTRYAAFVDEYGPDCAEVEAIPAPALREIVEDAILEHIPVDEWERLQKIEEVEREKWTEILAPLRNGGDR